MMMTPEQSRSLDEYLSQRHERFAAKPDKVLVDARELANYVVNMDFPEWALGDELKVYEMFERVLDIIDLTATLDNPGLSRGWLFSFQTYKERDAK